MGIAVERTFAAPSLQVAAPAGPAPWARRRRARPSSVIPIPG